MPAVFVSHASSDKTFVDVFVNEVLRLGCALSTDELFYSSGAATGVPSGKDLMDFVRSQAGDSSLVVAVISPVFQTRPICIAELGAAWARSGRLFPTLASKFRGLADWQSRGGSRSFSGLLSVAG